MDSVHFSDKISYITLLIWNYIFGDMIFGNILQKKTRNRGHRENWAEIRPAGGELGQRRGVDDGDGLRRANRRAVRFDSLRLSQLAPDLRRRRSRSRGLEALAVTGREADSGRVGPARRTAFGLRRGGILRHRM